MPWFRPKWGFMSLKKPGARQVRGISRGGQPGIGAEKKGFPSPMSFQAFLPKAPLMRLADFGKPFICHPLASYPLHFATCAMRHRIAIEGGNQRECRAKGFSFMDEPRIENIGWRSASTPGQAGGGPDGQSPHPPPGAAARTDGPAKYKNRTNNWKFNV